MEVFKLCRKYLMTVGINEHQLSSRHPFNTRNTISLIVSVLCVTSNAIYLLQVAKTFEEYTNTVYALSTAAVCTATYTVAILKMAKFLGILDCFQNIIDKSERVPDFAIKKYRLPSRYHPSICLLGLTKRVSKTIFTETNRKVEKWSRVMHLVVVETTPIFFGAQFLIVGFFLYYTTELGNDAFELQFPTWYDIPNYGLRYM